MTIQQAIQETQSKIENIKRDIRVQEEVLKILYSLQEKFDFEQLQKEIEEAEKNRWGDKPYCPRCGCYDVSKMLAKDGTRNKRFLWRCHGCKKQFTVRIRMIYEHSPLSIKIWEAAKNMNAFQVHKKYKITYKSAWLMKKKIKVS